MGVFSLGIKAEGLKRFTTRNDKQGELMKCNKCKESECKHDDLRYCSSCQKVECKKCGKAWGEKETVYLSYYQNPYWVNIPSIWEPQPQYPDYEITWCSYTIATDVIPGYCETKMN